jgi:hypothetical protein
VIVDFPKTSNLLSLLGDPKATKPLAEAASIESQSRPTAGKVSREVALIQPVPNKAGNTGTKLLWKQTEWFRPRGRKRSLQREAFGVGLVAATGLERDDRILPPLCGNGRHHVNARYLAIRDELSVAASLVRLRRIGWRGFGTSDRAEPLRRRDEVWTQL